MSLADYQKQIDDSVQPYAKPYWDPLSQLAGIAEEVGEVARILNHQYGDKPKKPTEAHKSLVSPVRVWEEPPRNNPSPSGIFSWPNS
jgi:NTP pyrophosphatase (non-canonical NTP hydrolase)